MSFLNINVPEERDAVIEDNLALKKRLKDRNLADRGYLMDRQRDLEETFQPVIASNEKMVQDIAKGLAPITERFGRNKKKYRSEEGDQRLVDSEDWLVVIMVPSLKAFFGSTWMMQ